MGSTYTRQSTFTDGDTITADLFNTEFDQLVAAFAATSGHSHDGTAGEGGPIGGLITPGITLGDNTIDVTLTFDGGSNDGVLKWMEDEDYFEFSDDILIASTEKLQFRDTAIYINSSADGQLDIVADTEIQIAATTIDINGAVALNGAITGATNITLSGELDAATLDISGNADIDGNLDVGGNLTVTGTTTFNGGTLTLGDSAADNVVFGADVNSSIIPNTDNTYDLGSASQEWRDLYLDGTAHIDTLDVDDNATVAGTLGVTGVLTTTATQVATGGITSGSNIVSDTDSTDDLGTTSVRWANLFVDGITATDQITATGFTGTLDGILGSGTAAAATVTTLDTSGAVNLNLTTDSTSSTSGALIVDGGVGIAKKLFVGTDLDVNGTTNLDAVDIDGAVQLDATLTVGANDQGYDVILYGDTASANMTWDTSADDLIFNGDAGLIVPVGQLTLGSTAVTSTAAELNILTNKAFLDEDNFASNSATGIASQQSIKAYVDGVTTTSITSTGALNSGSITSGFGTIDTGASAITTTGLISGGSLDIDNVLINGTTIGHTDDTDLITLANGAVTVAGEVSITGNLSVGGTTTVVDTVTMNAQNAVLFEGTTADDHETTLSIVDPTADRTINLPDQSGTIPVLAAASNIAITATPAELNILDASNSTIGSLEEIGTVATDDVFLAIDTSGGGLKRITRSTIVSGLATSSGLSNVIEDTSPQLGGNLDMNGADIVTTSNATIDLAPHGTGTVVVRGNTNSGTIVFNCEDNSHGQTLKAQPHTATVTNTMLLPAGDSSTLVSLVSTDTLTNKTLTAPKIADGGFIADANGNELVVFQTTGSAVNELEITNNASGSNPIIAATGGDTNIGITLTPKGTGEIVIGASNLNYGGAAITATGAELNKMDGDTSATSTTVADADRVVMNDDGTMVQVAVTDLAAYFDDEITAMPNLITTAATTVGALDSGSITSGFGTIDTGASAITTTGLITGGSLTVDDVGVDGKVITMTGSSNDTAVFTVGTNGVLSIVTTDAAAAAANIQITADGTAELAGTTVTLDSGGDIELAATNDVNLPANVGLTFGNDGEKIEGDGTDLTIAGNNINLTAVADVVIPANVGVTFGSGEKIEGDNTDLTITSGAKINLTATSDVHIPNDVGIVFGGASEKIEGDGTDLTISGADINLTAVGDVNIPSGVGLTFGDDGEKIEGNGTDLTITSGAKINLTATSDVHIPNDVGIVFGGDSEKIEGDGTDLTIAGNNINLTAAVDVNIDAAADIVLDAAGGNIEFKDAGTLQLTVDMDGTAGAQVVKLEVDSDDLIFKQYDGTTVLTLDDDTTVKVATDLTVGDDVSLISDGAVLAFGANSEVTLTHVHDTGLALKHTATADDKPIVLTLQTGETDIAADDELGVINFQAPNEGAGTDSILVAAGIAAVSEGDFSASNNATKLSFRTGASEAASEKMSLSSAGLLTIADDFIIKDGGTIGSASDVDAIAIASNGVVTFSQIPVFPNNTVETADIQANAITGAKIADNAINSEHYTDGSIDTAHIADSQITVAKMAANSVDSDQYVDGSIDAAHLASDSVTEAKIAANSIDSQAYVDGSIDTAHIADNQITLAKMAGIARGKLIVGDSGGNPAVIGPGSNGQVLTSDGTDIAFADAAGGPAYTRAASPPGSPSAGDWWLDTARDTSLYIYDGTLGWLTNDSFTFGQGNYMPNGSFSVLFAAGILKRASFEGTSVGTEESNFATPLDTNQTQGSFGLSNSVRGVFSAHNTTTTDTMEFIVMATDADSVDFGDLNLGRGSRPQSVSHATRGIIAGGQAPGATNAMDYITIATAGDATDFGNLSVARLFLPSQAMSSTVRSVFGGGYVSSGSDVLDYITVASTGNATDFGNLTVARYYGCCVNSTTRGILANGTQSGADTTIDYITIGTTGNATDFGDTTDDEALARCAVHSSTTAYLRGGVDQITMATAANATSSGYAAFFTTSNRDAVMPGWLAYNG